MKFYKYQGAGNDFLIADNRDGSVQLTTAQIAALCDRRYGVGADGLMLLESSDQYDFRMVYYNSDGSGGMMCGNGGRCIVAFAADMGLDHFDFEAADGFHTAQILENAGMAKTVRLKMKDVEEYEYHEALTGPECASDGYFLNTGTRHYVRFVPGLDAYDIVTEGRDIRYNAEELQPIGANVNFIEPYEGGIRVRTYEKGVEDETFACGTGIVASCVASYVKGVNPSEKYPDGRVRYDVMAKRDSLSVDFIPNENMVAQDVWLTGPATYVAQIIIDID
jgi:diaminopimelate epimerase